MGVVWLEIVLMSGSAAYVQLRTTIEHYAPYSIKSPENNHKLMEFYMEVLILGVIL